MVGFERKIKNKKKSQILREVVEGSMVVDYHDDELPVALSVVDESHLSDLDLPLGRPLGVVGGRRSVEVVEGIRMGERGRKTGERERGRGRESGRQGRQRKRWRIIVLAELPGL